MTKFLPYETFTSCKLWSQLVIYDCITTDYQNDEGLHRYSKCLIENNIQLKPAILVVIHALARYNSYFDIFAQFDILR